MTKENLKNADIYWFDADDNTLVIDENGAVYLVTNTGDISYVTDDIRKIYDEEKDDYIIDGMNIDKYIKSVRKASETTAAAEKARKLPQQQQQLIRQRRQRQQRLPKLSQKYRQG